MGTPPTDKIHFDDETPPVRRFRALYQRPADVASAS
jgi:hypothetical protein